MRRVRVLRSIHVGDRVRQRPIVPQTPGQNKRYVRAHALVQDPRSQPAGAHRLLYRPGVIDGIDRTHVVLVPCLDGAARSQTDPEGCAKQREFDVKALQDYSAPPLP